MSRQFSFVSLLSIAVGFASCGVSPLLHHVDPASASQLQEPRDAVVCPLSYPSLGLCASLDWVSYPSGETGGVMRLLFWKASGGSASGPYVSPPATIRVYLWMPEHGHGSSPVELASLRDTSGMEAPGQYSVSKIYFVMPGRWEIRVQLKDGSTVLGESSVSYLAR